MILLHIEVFNKSQGILLQSCRREFDAPNANSNKHQHLTEHLLYARHASTSL